MTASNAAIVAALAQLVAFTQLEDGQSQSFRTRAYEKAIDAIHAHPDQVGSYTVEQLKAIEGVGDSTARKIVEFSAHGSIGKVDRLKQRFPPTMLDLMRIPGLGPKTVLALQEHLDVTDVAGLEKAIAEQQLRTLPGLGQKSEEKIAAAIQHLGIHSDERRIPIFDAMKTARRVIADLDDPALVQRVEYAGSLRRLSETIGDIDILAVADDAAVLQRFVALPGVTAVLGSGSTKASVVIDDAMQVDLRVVPEEAFGAALMYFTGSKAHNIELRQRSLDRGWTLNEYSLSDIETGNVVASRTEEDVYHALDLPWITPEAREGLGEIGAADAGTLPMPLTVDDLRGDLHVHTTWSGDGRSTMTEMLDAVEERGLEYVALTDHAEDLTINGLSRDQVRKEAAEIARERERRHGLTILHGAELNIAPNGQIDYDPDFLAEVFDFGVASIHSHFSLDEAAQTDRLLTAIENPAVNVIGHPSGRKIGRRPGAVFNADAVFEAAAETGTAIEINSHLQRLDLAAPLIRKAMGVEGLLVAVSTDAHHTTELANVRWGVAQARKGWVPRERVLNSLTKPEFEAFIARKRKS